MKRITGCLILLIGLGACNQPKEIPKATTYDFPSPVDTSTKPIDVQEKQVFDLGQGIFMTNDFPAARLNDVKRANDTLLVATIASESYPVNNSPWYAFKAWSEQVDNVYLRLEYKDARHRYHPKVSADGRAWEELEAGRLIYDADSVNVTLKLNLSSDTLWVAAQEIYDTQQVRSWAEGLAIHDRVALRTIGQSTKGRDLILLDISKDNKKNKDLIVLLSRQHPPEVTGFFALQAFLEELIKSPLLDDFLDQYSILVYPLLNPDGVDMGHWRHNAGGVDLNRDWAYYRQPETRQVADHIVKMQYESGGKVTLGLDFHSTWEDVFYTQDKKEQFTPLTPWFREQWFAALEAGLPGYKVNEKPKGLATPVTKGWFYSQFKSEGMTYEIGDDTHRDTIQLIGKITSGAMMQILLDHSLK